MKMQMRTSIVQDPARNGVYALNNLIQKSVHSANDFKTINEQLNENIDEYGNYSWAVLDHALKPLELHLTHIQDPKYYTNPDLGNAYVINPGDHWYTIRNIDNTWILFDSILSGPQRIPNITQYFSLIVKNGVTILLVEGNLPASTITDNDLNHYPKAELQDEDFASQNSSYSTDESVQNDLIKPFFQILEKVEKEVFEDAYIICDANQIIYPGIGYDAAYRFYKHLKDPNSAVYNYKKLHPNSALTSIKILPPEESSPTKVAFTEALIQHLEKELGLNLEVDKQKGRNMINKRKERIPPPLLEKLNNHEERQVIINGLKHLLKKAVTDSVRITEEDAGKANNQCSKNRRSNPVEREAENSHNRKSYHNRPPGDDPWTAKTTTIAEEIQEKPPNVQQFLKNMSEEEFARQIRGPYSAHKFAARWGFIVNSRICNKCTNVMRFARASCCGFKWTCYHTESGKQCSSAPCCKDSIFKINRAGGLYTILQILHKMALGKPPEEIVKEFGKKEKVFALWNKICAI
uniref:ubiquitinyl hydrolase 1 n=1 Tax=Panagrolaimus davidi TaxID=227884 RepID=A0A914P710_9BILA